VAGVVALGATLCLLPVQLCLSAALLHIPCPGCGMTRATLALLRGDWSAALAFHPLSVLVAPLAAVLAIEHAARYIRSGRVFAPSAPWRDLLLAGLAASLLAVWILRFFGSFGGPAPI
jgi:hypothetical protein